MEKQLALLASGSQLAVLATDPMARIDIPLHCRQHGHHLQIEAADGFTRFVITKA